MEFVDERDEAGVVYVDSASSVSTFVAISLSAVLPYALGFVCAIFGDLLSMCSQCSGAQPLSTAGNLSPLSLPVLLVRLQTLSLGSVLAVLSGNEA